MPGFAGSTLPDEYAALLDGGLGGICLFGSNTADGPAATTALVAAIHEAGPGSVVAVDEEGGDVTRLHATEGSPVLGAAALGSADDLALTEATGTAIGHDLAGHGIDVCLGPVADLNTNAANPVIGTRSFGTDPQRASEHVAAWVRGLQATGTAACVKHFPGHGDTADDSHLSLPVVAADLDTLTHRELVPFGAAVDAGCRAVMTSHIVVAAVDTTLPATFSAPVLELLRHRLGFRGPVVSDALDMAGASGGTRTVPEAAVLALAAGVDLLCLGPATDPALVRDVRDAVVRAVADSRLARTRLAEAAERAATLRAAAPTATDVPAPTDRAAVRVEGDLPDLRDAALARIESTPSIAVGAVPWGLPTDLAVDADDPDAAGRLLALGRPLVLQVRDAHRFPAVLALLDRVAPAVVVEWGWPGPSTSGTPRICTHGTSLPAYAAVRELLA
jgi:beta-N-acetylhexosaminidase